MRRHTRSYRTSRFKRGAQTVNRPHEGRAQVEIPCTDRSEGPLDPEVPVDGPDLGLCGSAGTAGPYPEAAILLGDHGYEADWHQNPLIELGIAPCIQARAGRKILIERDAGLNRLRHKIEKMFARLNDWQRIATRYDRCTTPFHFACALAATVTNWL